MEQSGRCHIYITMSDSNKHHARRWSGSTASRTTLLVMIQVVSRLCTFAANQLVLRNLSPATVGIAAQLDLFMVTVLYFSREAVRLAIQRQPTPSVPDATTEKLRIESSKETRMESMATQSVVNMAYLSLGIGIPVTTLLGASYTRFASEKVSRTHFYRESVVLTSIASVLELSTEPFFAVVQHCMLYKIRAIVEMVAAFAKSITTCGIFAWASWNGYDIGILPFALGHIAYSLVLLCGYSGAIASAPSRTRFSFLLTRIKTRYVESFL